MTENLRLLDRIHQRNDFGSIELLMLISPHLKKQTFSEKFQTNIKRELYLHLQQRRVYIRVKIVPEGVIH